MNHSSKAPINTTEPVDVIVPVFRGIEEVRACIDSIHKASVKTAFRLILINDASPEPDVTFYLRSLTSYPNVTLIENKENLGFVATVNLGMALHPKSDVVLLNSDTEVANDWLDRIVAAAQNNPSAGTITPFSNNATICSFPRFCQDNPMPEQWSLCDLDSVFAKVNTGKVIDIPTGVGFCMYIRRRCLDEVGYFDVETFGKGYGEENDFCMRAREHGWRNILLTDTFIYHAGGVSFADTQEPRKAHAMESMRRLHPQYDTLVQEHIDLDPALTMRQLAELGMLSLDERPVILLVLHNHGGGTARHVRDLRKLLGKQAHFLILQPARDGTGETVLSHPESVNLNLRFQLDQDYPLLVQVLAAAGVRRIHFHHTIGLHPATWGLARSLGVEYDITLHDYYFICPQITLTDKSDRYCGELGAESCARCLDERPAPGRVSIETWRSISSRFLEGAARIFVPSRDVASRFVSYFPKLNLTLAPHPEQDWQEFHQERLPPPVNQERMRIVVVGALSKIKGADVLEACALDANQRGLPIDFILLGYAYRSLVSYPRSNLVISGAYADSELHSLLQKARAHLAWFPAQCPETYSYTLSACLRARLPIVTTDLGSLPERAQKQPLCWVMPWKTSAKQWNDFFVSLPQLLAEPEGAAIPTEAPSHEQLFNYETDYLHEPISKTQPPVTPAWESLRITLEMRNMPPPASHALGPRIRIRLYRLIARMRALPWLRPIVRRVPHIWQVRVKRLLLKV